MPFRAKIRFVKNEILGGVTIDNFYVEPVSKTGLHIKA